MKLKIVLIRWLDATGSSVKMPLTEALKLKLQEVVEVGILIHEDDEKLLLCSTIYPPDANLGEKQAVLEQPFLIPKALVKEVRELGEVKIVMSSLELTDEDSERLSEWMGRYIGRLMKEEKV